MGLREFPECIQRNGVYYVTNPLARKTGTSKEEFVKVARQIYKENGIDCSNMTDEEVWQYCDPKPLFTNVKIAEIEPLPQLNKMEGDSHEARH